MSGGDGVLEMRAFGQTGLEVSVLGLGGAGFLMDLHGHTEEAECEAILHHARAAGITYFDTAPLYRQSEARLGVGLGDDAGAIIATKVGAYDAVPMLVDFSPEMVRRTVACSRERLRRETLDVVQVHELTREAWPAVFEPGGGLDALEALRDEGAISWLGVTGSDPAVLVQAVETGRFDMVQVWRRWNLLDRSADRLLDVAAARGVGVVIGTPLASGVLVGDLDNTYLYEPPPPHVAATVMLLREAAEAHGVPLAAVALQFCMDDRVSVVIAGVDRQAHIDVNVGHATTPIPSHVIQSIAGLAARETGTWPEP